MNFKSALITSINTNMFTSAIEVKEKKLKTIGAYKKKKEITNRNIHIIYGYLTPIPDDFP